jgi:hypothetical protein
VRTSLSLSSKGLFIRISAFVTHEFKQKVPRPSPKAIVKDALGPIGFDSNITYFFESVAHLKMGGKAAETDVCQQMDIGQSRNPMMRAILRPGSRKII